MKRTKKKDWNVWVSISSKSYHPTEQTGFTARYKPENSAWITDRTHWDWVLWSSTADWRKSKKKPEGLLKQFKIGWFVYQSVLPDLAGDVLTNCLRLDQEWRSSKSRKRYCGCLGQWPAAAQPHATPLPQQFIRIPVPASAWKMITDPTIVKLSTWVPSSAAVIKRPKISLTIVTTYMCPLAICPFCCFQAKRFRQNC